MKPVHGTLFMDYGTDLDSGESVIGDPAGTRGKPGRWVPFVVATTDMRRTPSIWYCDKDILHPFGRRLPQDMVV